MLEIYEKIAQENMVIMACFIVMAVCLLVMVFCQILQVRLTASSVEVEWEEEDEEECQKEDFIIEYLHDISRRLENLEYKKR